ncbi:MAG: pyridoxal phosphate-dependent aminotransferase [Proteobacteria bacterium]|nr:pyridoxal phosphate-dependent aminotransferase [Pseudomonadota bacterium]MBU4469925.1 pyridoxal phosphate-dependent aminotransferase [Pseudomonadota bacterium]MCG2753687.1 pyridoxal phosphate-dependent aminotransferase [Desulfobacteraceae bacterium]
MKLSERILNIQESKTVQFTPMLQKMRREGKLIFDFAVGEPDFETPLPIIDATKKALDDLKTRYGPVPGLSELRLHLAKAFDGYSEENIILSNGSKMSLYSIFQVICNPGDEVIVPRPYWVSFVEQIKLAGGVPVIVDTKNHHLDPEAIEQAMTDKTRAMIINSPNNPTGAVYPESTLREVLGLAESKGIYVVSDEAYDHFIYDVPEPGSLFSLGIHREALIVVKSFSKHYNMTGFRIGYVAASREIVHAMTRFQGHTSGNVCTFAQYGALAAVFMNGDLSQKEKAELKHKRDLAYHALSALVPCVRPDGTFYVFPNISSCLKKDETSGDFARDVLEKTGVAVVPGEAFGMDGHIRLSYAAPENLLTEGLERLCDYIKNRS